MFKKVDEGFLKGISIPFRNHELISICYMKRDDISMGFGVDMLSEWTLFHVGISIPYISFMVQILAWGIEEEVN